LLLDFNFDYVVGCFSSCSTSFVASKYIPSVFMTATFINELFNPKYIILQQLAEKLTVTWKIKFSNTLSVIAGTFKNTW
ncbi:hypothetical protein MKW94_009350, partial [Papaver nudicaule]|nr:hypothetical protein [Papaver nudicaule]